MKPEQYAAIDVFENVSRQSFVSEIAVRGTPAVLKGLVRDWPIVAMALESEQKLCTWLKSISLEKPVQTFFAAPQTGGFFTYTPDLKGFNFERNNRTVGQILNDLTTHSNDAGAPYRYAGAINVPHHMPKFLEQHGMPLLGDDKEQLISLWLGNRTRVPAHWDLPQNIACVVAGRRRFTLFPIEQVPNLYIGPLDVTLAGQPSSLVDPWHPDLERYPRFAEAAKHARVAVLEPGDALYIPSMWLHHVESLDTLGVLANFWWRDGVARFTPLYTLMHALLSLHDIPARERQAWRTLFDHYVFDADEETLAHLPPDARSVLGDLNQEQEDNLRKFLASRLVGHLTPRSGAE